MSSRRGIRIVVLLLPEKDEDGAQYIKPHRWEFLPKNEEDGVRVRTPTCT